MRGIHAAGAMQAHCEETGKSTSRDRHNHDDLPLILLGQGGGSVTPGRHLRYDGGPVMNLWRSMLDRVGAQLAQLGESTGRILLA